MVVSHAKTVDAFESHTGKVKSNSMETISKDGYTALIGYGHAVYAVKVPRGDVVVFAGWAFRGVRMHSGSPTTKSSHFPKIPTHSCDALVAYNKPRTGQEQGFYNSADVVSDNEPYVAPKRHGDWKQKAEWALNQA